MGFFNRVAGMFGKRAVQVAAAAELRARIAEYINRPTFHARGYLTATHRTSHRTVSMDLRDAKKRRNIAKRKGS